MPQYFGTLAPRFRAFFHIHEVNGIRKGNKGPGVTDFVTQDGALISDGAGCKSVKWMKLEASSFRLPASSLQLKEFSVFPPAYPSAG
jgi:hypothetical protein